MERKRPVHGFASGGVTRAAAVQSEGRPPVALCRLGGPIQTPLKRKASKY